MQKTYEQILEERRAGTGSKDTGLVKVDHTSLIQAKDMTEMLKLADELVPQVNKSLMLNEVGLPAERREQWLATVDDALHAQEILPRRRTKTEKNLAVLQSNRHPTAGAKFHQAVLEQGTYTGIFMDESFKYQTEKIKFEKDLYYYNKKLEKLENWRHLGKDTFILEKNIELMRVKLAKQVMTLKGIEAQIQNVREELIEWRDIKEKLFKQAEAEGEFWSPNANDGDIGYQELPLVLRHFQNYVALKSQPDGSDISSALNIEGLAATAMTEGISNGKLGIYLYKLTDQQIKIVFGGLYNKNIDVVRYEDHISFVLDGGEAMTFPITQAGWTLYNEQKQSLLENKIT